MPAQPQGSTHSQHGQGAPQSPYEVLRARHVVHVDAERSYHKPSGQLKSVAITGTTGSLGSGLLEVLVREKSIESIVCANRSADGEARTKGILPHLGEAEWAKVSFEQLQITAEGLELAQSGYERLKHVDALVHCAWIVNFKRELFAFEDQIRGLRALVELMPRALRHQRLFFASSIGAAMNHPDRLVPEEVFDQPGWTSNLDYGRSKSIAEGLLYDASLKYLLPITVLRIGQVAGHDPFLVADDSTLPYPSRPPWNRNEWFPTMMRTCRNLGKIPERITWPLSWIPMNTFCYIVRDIIAKDMKEDGFRLYNLVNPRQGEWSSVVRALGHFAKPQVVSYDEWVVCLQSLDAKSPDNLRKYPAMRLVSFFSENSHGAEERLKRDWRTDNGRAASAIMTDIEPVGERQIRFWLEQWGVGGDGGGGGSGDAKL